MIVTKSHHARFTVQSRSRLMPVVAQKLEKELLLQQQQQKKEPRIKSKRREVKLPVSADSSSNSTQPSDTSTSPSESENTSGADADTEESITSEEEAERATKPPSDKWVTVKAEQQPQVPAAATGSEPQAPGAWEPESQSADANADASPSA